MKTLEEMRNKPDPEVLPPYVEKIQNEVDLMRYYFDVLRDEVKARIATVWVVLLPACVAIGFLLAKVL